MTAFRSISRKAVLSALVGLWAGLAAAQETPASGEPAQGESIRLDKVIVLANKNLPASVELANYYLQKRELSPEQLCLLDLPVTEEITRGVYEARLREPLLQWLRQRGYIRQKARNPKSVGSHESGWRTERSQIMALVSLYGVPVRIADTKPRLITGIAARAGKRMEQDRAAVDSELAGLLLPGMTVPGPRGNPFYDRLTRAELGPDSYMLIPATRLDGPDPSRVRALIDQSLEAEYYGLQGRAYFDIRGIRSSAYYTGDYWIRESYERFLREGYECDVDQRDAVFPYTHPMQDAAVYLGWYTEHVSGPFTRKDFQLAPGALAYHLHSLSARELRTPELYWAGPLVNRGAAASMGAVYEPFLRPSINLRILSDRLCSGYSLSESAYMAMPYLSWQMTVLGDPLYRPFKYRLEQQIQHMEQDNHPMLAYGYQRLINRLVAQGRFNVALQLCREKIQQTDSDVLKEKLADLYAINNLTQEAAELYSGLIESSSTPETVIRVADKYTRMLGLLKQDARAEEVRTDVRERLAENPMLPWLER